MKSIATARLKLTPFSSIDFDLFVETMLTDPIVTEHYHSYKEMDDLKAIRANAKEDFWDHFEESRINTGFEIWSIFENQGLFAGWAGLLETPLTACYRGPELQYMLASSAHGKGYATEACIGVLNNARDNALTERVIATVDIPNTASIRVLEKLGFSHEGQIEAYGITEMYLYTMDINSVSFDVC